MPPRRRRALLAAAVLAVAVGVAAPAIGALRHREVAKGAATATLKPGVAIVHGSLPGTTRRDVNVAATLTLPKGSRSANVTAFVQVRQHAGVAYRFWATARGGRFESIGVSRVNGSRATQLAMHRLSPAVPGANGLELREQAVGGDGTVLSLRAWAKGRPEPKAWTLTADDATAALQISGSLGVGAQRASRAGTVSVRFAAISVADVPQSAAPVGTAPAVTLPIATAPVTTAPVPGPVPAQPVPPVQPPPVTTAPVTTEPTVPTVPTIDPNVTFVGAGDIGDCRHPWAAETAKLVEAIPGTVFTAGDNAYPDGTAANYRDCYAPTWGAFWDRTRPAIGDQEYASGSPAAYFQYFAGKDLGSPSQGWYQYDLGTSWHVIVLNSQCGAIGGCGGGSPEVKWLQAQLAANARPCVVAIMHIPRWSSGGNQPQNQTIWSTLVAGHVTMLISGHAHDYERFAPQDANGNLSAGGVTQFVVGTGGAGGGTITTVAAHSLAHASEGRGVIDFTLEPNGYTWKFVSVPRYTFTDSGSATCS